MVEILPQFDPPSIVNGVISSTSAAAALTSVPRISGMGTITLSGTIVNGDVLTLKFTASFLPGGAVSVSVPLTGSDTLTTAQTKMATAILNNSALQACDVQAVIHSGAIIVVWPGPLGSYVTMSMTKTGTGTEAAAFTQVTGGSGPIIPKADIRFNYNGAHITLPFNQPVTLPTAELTALLATPQSVS